MTTYTLPRDLTGAHSDASEVLEHRATAIGHHPWTGHTGLAKFSP